jgi:hypothetical protein
LQRGLKDVGLNGLAGAGAADGDSSWTLLDLTGDGKRDLVITATQVSFTLRTPGYPSDPHWEVYPNTGTGFGARASWTLPRGGTGSGGYLAASHLPLNVPGDTAWTTTDLNGDRKPDLVVTGQLEGGGQLGVYQFGRLANEPQWRVFKNTGQGFAMEAHRWITPSGGHYDKGFSSTAGKGAKVGDESFSLIDLNADAQPELVITANTVEDPLNPGGGFTIDVAPGLGTRPRWRVYRNVP